MVVELTVIIHISINPVNVSGIYWDSPVGIIAASMKTKRLRPITSMMKLEICIGIYALSIHIRAIKAMSSVRIDIYMTV